MQGSNEPRIPELGSTPDKAARRAGLLLLLTAGVTAVMVAARVAADADLDTMLESLRAVADSRTPYTISGVARLLSGVTLAAAGWYLLRTWIISGRFATPLVPYLFVISGAFTLVSGAAAMVIGLYPSLDTLPDSGPSALLEAVYHVRWFAGKVGFSAVGVALLIAARFQWKVGQTLRKVSPVSALLGLAIQLIWLDAANFLHPIIGTVFFFWLLVIGTMLSTGRVERHFINVFGRRQSEGQQ